MTFYLPFTFTARDRVAVVSYFARWLDAHGAGSAGPFYCGPPQAVVERSAAEKRRAGLLPGIAATVWLKPYDLGVSQRIEIHTPTDPDTGEYIARVTLRRLSGHAAAWDRTVRPFLALLRKQFLNWRVATEEERVEMFDEARRLLRARALGTEAHA